MSMDSLKIEEYIAEIDTLDKWRTASPAQRYRGWTVADAALAEILIFRRLAMAALNQLEERRL